MNDNSAIAAIIGQAAAQTMKDGKIDTNSLMESLTGRYEINGKELHKIEQCQIPSADAGRNDTGVDRKTENVEIV